MKRRLFPDRYAGRRLDCSIAYLTLDKEAHDLLRHFASEKRHGAFVSRLIFEHAARLEERQRLTPLLEAAEPVAAPPGFDDLRYYLGKLCPQEHAYQETGQSLRRTSSRECLQCERERKQRAHPTEVAHGLTEE